ncbi:MAG: sulfatase-like hydrolase/transferase [Chloroflexi bacterium]|nr:sulfatase-like hydrolase/transferase [Chloroflexota bacterium]
MTDRPNMLIVMTDQQKATSLGLYGNPDVRTPHIERLAAGGICFTQAYTPHPLCVPARASFWTGRWPHQHGSRTNQLLLPPGMDGYLPRLNEAGYTLGLIGKNHCFQRDDLERFDAVYLAGHQGPMDTEGDPAIAAAKAFFATSELHRPRTAALVNPHPPEACTTGLVAERAARFIAAQRGIARPWALWLSIPDPHSPYQAPEPYASRFDPDGITLPPWEPDELAHKPERVRVFYDLMRFRDATEADFRRCVAMYYAMVAFIDDAVGRVLGVLEQTGQAEDTIVVFLSDHGDYAGEHRMVAKSSTFYDCLTRVPLLLRFPGRVPAGQTCPELVSTMDVLPTCFALAGLDGPPGVSSRPLPAPYIPGGGWPRDAVFSEYGAGGPPVRLRDVQAFGDGQAIGTVRAMLNAREAQGRPKMVRAGRWKYCWDPLDPDDEARELYDLDADPWELHNLASDPAHAQLCAALERRLLRWSVATEDAAPRPLFFDPTTYDNAQVSFIPEAQE